MKIGPCKECGTENYCVNYMRGGEKDVMDAESLCFSCAFWTLRMREQEKPQKVVVDGVMYHVSPPARGFQGFGGAPFSIAFNDGRRVDTTNLWCNGHIPEHFKARIPDNAVFQKAD